MSCNVRRRTRRPILKALRMARADAGLTISELAKRAGVSRDTISNAERGEHSLQASTLHKIARALGKAPSELLAEEERLVPKVESGSSLEPPLLNGLEERRRASIARFVERWRRHIEACVAHYEMRMAEAEHGGFFEGHEGAKVLFEEAWTEFRRLLDVTNGEMAERWLEDPEVPEDVKTELGFALVESFNRMGRTIARISEREAALAETEAQLQEAEQRRQLIRELNGKNREISA
jgi:transcriptional regulator with XRE-family HTH domain